MLAKSAKVNSVKSIISKAIQECYIYDYVFINEEV